MTDKHYVAIDAIGWAVADDAETALRKRVNDSGTILTTFIYEVPLGVDVEYEIKMFVPQVPGTKIVKKIVVMEPTEPEEVEINAEDETKIHLQ